MAPLSDVDRSLITECAMSDATEGLNAALEGRYAIERRWFASCLLVVLGAWCA